MTTIKLNEDLNLDIKEPISIDELIDILVANRGNIELKRLSRDEMNSEILESYEKSLKSTDRVNI